ncbi:MAG: DUF177 domain-containing protein [Schleiferiaceae bacterium]|nr:DUF177 domain-containing protein [Schleiferiaceae bacterium]
MQHEIKGFEIEFAGLKEGMHQYQFELGPTFFAEFDYGDFQEPLFQAEVQMEKKSNSLEFQFKVKGDALVYCDITTDPFRLPMEQETQLQVKFGASFDDTDEAILWLPEAAHRLNVAQYLYELAVLARPLKVVHPEVAKGNRGQEALQKLQELSPENRSDQKEDEIDPRWDKLRDLLN